MLCRKLSFLRRRLFMKFIRLRTKHLKEVLRLNLRCFPKGENYTKYTFNYLLEMPNGLSYRAVTGSGDMAAFLFVASDDERHRAYHDHRRCARTPPARSGKNASRKSGKRSARTADFYRGSRSSRRQYDGAKSLPNICGYAITQRINKYYNNGEDCFLMVKSIFSAKLQVS